MAAVEPGSSSTAKSLQEQSEIEETKKEEDEQIEPKVAGSGDVVFAPGTSIDQKKVAAVEPGSSSTAKSVQEQSETEDTEKKEAEQIEPMVAGVGDVVAAPETSMDLIAAENKALIEAQATLKKDVTNINEFSDWISAKTVVVKSELNKPAEEKSLKAKIGKAVGLLGPIVGAVSATQYLAITIATTVLTILGSTALFGIPLIPIIATAAACFVISAAAIPASRVIGSKLQKSPATEKAYNAINLAMLKSLENFSPETEGVNYSELAKKIDKSMNSSKVSKLANKFVDNLAETHTKSYTEDSKKAVTEAITKDAENLMNILIDSLDETQKQKFKDNLSADESQLIGAVTQELMDNMPEEIPDTSFISQMKGIFKKNKEGATEATTTPDSSANIKITTEDFTAAIKTGLDNAIKQQVQPV